MSVGVLHGIFQHDVTALTKPCGGHIGTAKLSNDLWPGPHDPELGKGKMGWAVR